MNKKNNENRQSASLNRIAHKRLKEFADMRGFKLNHVLDDAVFMYLKMQITAPMVRGTGE